ncbi:MAG: hypothetical protein AAF928_08290 [Myxococcota bacterium]
MLRQSTGTLYDELRDAALDDFDAISSLVVRDRDQASWRRWLLATMVERWRENADRYRSLVDEVASVDPTPYQRQAAGLNGLFLRYHAKSGELGEDYLPLYLERLWKHREGMPGWQQMVWLYMAKRHSLVGVTDLLLEVATAAEDPAVAALVVEMLTDRPEEGLATRLDDLSIRFDHLAAALQRGARRLSTPS